MKKAKAKPAAKSDPLQPLIDRLKALADRIEEINSSLRADLAEIRKALGPLGINIGDQQQ